MEPNNLPTSPTDEARVNPTPPAPGPMPASQTTTGQPQQPVPPEAPPEHHPKATSQNFIAGGMAIILFLSAFFAGLWALVPYIFFAGIALIAIFRDTTKQSLGSSVASGFLKMILAIFMVGAVAFFILMAFIIYYASTCTGKCFP